MKIYTKTGDKGMTSLGSGKRLSKASLRVEAFGEIDELNCALGICRSMNKNKFLEKILKQLQKDLWMIGADLASPQNKKVGGKKVPRVGDADVRTLEKWIDIIDAKLPELKNFIVPGGSLLAANLHLARALCRRAERAVVKLSGWEIPLGKASLSGILIYVNRLSDLLFTMARYANKIEKIAEEKLMNI